MKKILTVIGTRPEIIKLSVLIEKLDQHADHILVHTGQNYDYELNEVFFKELGLREPNYFLDSAGASPIQTIANVLSKIEPILLAEKPDGMVVYGDTNSCLAVIAAKRLKIPVFHFDAGNRSFDQRVPEELNRKVVDHLSDINFVLTEHARRYLLAEGLPPDRVFKLGGHMTEVIEKHYQQIMASTILSDLGLQKNRYFIVSLHREENVDDEENLRSLIGVLDAVAQRYKVPVLVSCHPRTKARLQGFSINVDNDLVKMLRPFGFFDYLKLQLDSKCVISDSGTIFEEASILRFPAVTVRNAHERPEGVDAGSVMLCDLDPDDVIAAVEVVLSGIDENYEIQDYVCPNVSSRAIRAILGYTSFVDKSVWKKY